QPMNKRRFLRWKVSSSKQNQAESWSNCQRNDKRSENRPDIGHAQGPKEIPGEPRHIQDREKYQDDRESGIDDGTAHFNRCVKYDLKERASIRRGAIFAEPTI